MDKSPQKLWRKIGIEKNFLEGTSYSDSQHNTISSNQQSLNSERGSGMSNKPVNSVHQETELVFENVSKGLEEKSNERGLQIRNEQSIETPIQELNFSHMYQRFQSFDYTSNIHRKQQKNKLKYNQQRQSNQNVHYLRSNSHYFESNVKLVSSLQLKQQSQINANSDINNRMYRNSSNFNPRNTSRPSRQLQSSLIHILESSGTHDESRKNLTRNVSKIDVRYKDQNKRIETRMSQKSGSQMDDRVTGSLESLKKFNEANHMKNDFRVNKLSFVEFLVFELKQTFIEQKNTIHKQFILMKESLISMIRDGISEKLMAFVNQIGYLYSENKDLMHRIQQLQMLLKKKSDQHEQLGKKLSQVSISREKQINEKSEMIVKLQNDINRLYEKMEEVEELQTTKSLLSQRVKELEYEIECYHERQAKFQQKIKAKSQEISSKEQKIVELEVEVNQLYMKVGEIESRIKSQSERQLSEQERKFSETIKKKKNQFESELQKTKTESIEAISLEYDQVLQELIKKINACQVESIFQIVDIQKNAYMKKVANKVLEFNKCTKDSGVSNKKSKPSIQQLLRGGTNNQSESDDSNAKNLKMTGFFGNSSKANLHMRLDDISKKYSTERAEFNEQLAEYKRMYEVGEVRARNNSEHSPQEYDEYAPRYSKDRSHNTKSYSYLGEEKTTDQAQMNRRLQAIEVLNSRSKERIQKIQVKNAPLSSTSNSLDISFTNNLNQQGIDGVSSMYKHSFSELNLATLNSPSNSLRYGNPHTESSYFKKSNFLKNKNQNRIEDRQSLPRENFNEVVERVRNRISQRLEERPALGPMHQSKQPEYAKQHPANNYRTSSPFNKGMGQHNLASYESEARMKTYNFANQRINQRNPSPIINSRSKSNNKPLSPGPDLGKLNLPYTPRQSTKNLTANIKPTEGIKTDSFNKSYPHRPINSINMRTEPTVVQTRKQPSMHNSLQYTPYSMARLQNPRKSFNLKKY